MSGQIITRSDMVEWMKTVGEASVETLPCQNWRRMNVVVAEQGRAQVHAELADFHLIELHYSGRHYTEMHSETEQGDYLTADILPGSLSYVQCRREVEQFTEGLSTLQQFYIDQSVFADVAYSAAKGDPDTVRLLAFQGAFDPDLKALLNSVVDEARLGAPGGELYADLLAQQIALHIVRRNLAGKERILPDYALSGAQLARVIEFMDANLKGANGLNHLARTIDMDTVSFTRGFKAATGQAPHAFFLERRFARVKELLLQSNTALQDIALTTGFANQAQLTTSFLNQFGIVPKAWRDRVMA